MSTTTIEREEWLILLVMIADIRAELVRLNGYTGDDTDEDADDEE